MKKVLQKMRRGAGFTLAETLIAVVILVMITAGALPAAMTAYRNAVDAANAQVLLSAAVNALRGELSTASEVEQGDNGAILYKSSGVDHGSKISLDTDGTIMLEQYGQISERWLEGKAFEDSAHRDARPLLSSAMRQSTRDGNKPMTVTYGKEGQYVSVGNGYVEITGLRVERDSNTIAEMPGSLVIRVMTMKGDEDE